MARHSIRVVFDPERGDFTRVSIEPGAPMLDPSQANYRVLARWLGEETVAEPILSPDERSVSFHVTREGKRQLELRALPMTAEELDGEYAPALAEIERKLQEATWNNDGERALLKRALENWNFLKSPEGRDARLAHWFKYEAGQGQWRPLWCWGYMLRHEAIPFPCTVLLNLVAVTQHFAIPCAACTLFVHRQAATGGKPRCPHCRGAVADPKPFPVGARNISTGGTGVPRSKLLAGGVAAAALLMLGLLWWLNRPDDKETKPAPPTPNPGKLAQSQPQTPHGPSRPGAGSEGQGSKGNPNGQGGDQPHGGPDAKSHGDDFSSPAVAHNSQRSGDGTAPSSESSSEGSLPVATTSGDEKPTASARKEQDGRTATSDASGDEKPTASARKEQDGRTATSDASGDEKSTASARKEQDGRTATSDASGDEKSTASARRSKTGVRRRATRAGMRNRPLRHARSKTGVRRRATRAGMRNRPLHQGSPNAKLRRATRAGMRNRPLRQNRRETRARGNPAAARRTDQSKTRGDRRARSKFPCRPSSPGGAGMEPSRSGSWFRATFRRVACVIAFSIPSPPGSPRNQTGRPRNEAARAGDKPVPNWSAPLRPTEDNQAYNLNLQVETPDGKTVQRPLRLNVESNVKVKLDAPKTP